MIDLPYLEVLGVVLAACLLVIVGAFIYELRTGKFVNSRWVTVPFAIMIIAVVAFFLFTVLGEVVKW